MNILNKYNKTPWDNKYFNWNNLSKIRVKERLFCEDDFNYPNVVGQNFKKIKNNKTVVFVGYDSAGPLHIGSLIPLLYALKIMKDYNLRKLIVSINDVEAINSRGIDKRNSDKNILRIKKIVMKVISLYSKNYNFNLDFHFIVRGSNPFLWKEFNKIKSLPQLKEEITKYYGFIPKNHFMSLIVMCSEFIRLLKKNDLLVIYGYEEYIHIKFIISIKKLIGLENKLNFLLFLPIKSLNNSKMSKSDPINAIFLTGKLPKVIKDYTGIMQFIGIWNLIFSRNYPLSDPKVSLRKIFKSLL